jgi:hypothetical protein
MRRGGSNWVRSSTFVPKDPTSSTGSGGSGRAGVRPMLALEAKGASFLALVGVLLGEVPLGFG